MNSVRTVDWKKPNIAASVFLASCFILALIPTPEIGLISADAIRAIVTAIGANFAREVFKVFTTAIREFSPQTKLEAKIANEQIKSLATFVNSCSAACFALIVLGTFLTQRNEWILMSIVGSIAILATSIASRSLLSNLKNEDKFSEGAV